MMNYRHSIRTVLAGAAVVVAVAGCSVLQPNANLAAFSTTMTGANEVPPVMTNATGTVYAQLNTDTRLLKWKVSYTGLSGPATMAHFHGPAVIGANAKVTLAFRPPITSPFDGQANLTPDQVAELMGGKWYVNIHSRAHPGGEIRGWLVMQP